MLRRFAAVTLITAVTAALAGVTFVACFYDFDRTGPVHDAGPASTRPTPTPTSTTTAPPPRDGSPDQPPPVEAGPTDCPAQDVTWNVDGSACSAPLGDVLVRGATRTLTDSVPEETGKATVACDGGAIDVTQAACSPPVVIDVSGPTGCVNGFCDASLGGTCGGGDPNRAKAICVWKGFDDVTDFTLGSGQNGSLSCQAAGLGCFTNQNATCNAVFTSVSCRF